MPVEVELFDDLDAVARDANGALDRSARASLFERLDWYRLTATHTGLKGAPLILRARDDDARAWLFLTVDKGRARPLGSWYTLRHGAICGSTEGEKKLATALAYALKDRRQLIAEVDLYPLDEADILPWAFKKAGWLTRRSKSDTNWIANTQGLDFEAWWAARPARLRNTARRKAMAAELDIALHRSFDDAAWSDYEAVYRASWKPSEGSSAFLRELAEQEGAAGTLRLGIATKDGKPVAAQFWLVENGVATIHKLAHVESARALSPGTVLSVAMFRDVIDQDKPSLIDFGTGDDVYKADWMDERRPLYRLTAFNPLTLAGLSGPARRLVGRLVGRKRTD